MFSLLVTYFVHVCNNNLFKHVIIFSILLNFKRSFLLNFNNFQYIILKIYINFEQNLHLFKNFLYKNKQKHLEPLSKHNVLQNIENVPPGENSRGNITWDYPSLIVRKLRKFSKSLRENFVSFRDRTKRDRSLRNARND